MFKSAANQFQKGRKANAQEFTEDRANSSTDLLKLKLEHLDFISAKWCRWNAWLFSHVNNWGKKIALELLKLKVLSLFC